MLLGTSSLKVNLGIRVLSGPSDVRLIWLKSNTISNTHTHKFSRLHANKCRIHLFRGILSIFLGCFVIFSGVKFWNQSFFCKNNNKFQVWALHTSLKLKIADVMTRQQYFQDLDGLFYPWCNFLGSVSKELTLGQGTPKMAQIWQKKQLLGGFSTLIQTDPTILAR